ncbi:MAG: hypothetical protein JWO06_2294 [Bacteroidota bacterium]|nr:hypothetical protein [Bacteroidota bacterium]
MGVIYFSQDFGILVEDKLDYGYDVLMHINKKKVPQALIEAI